MRVILLFRADPDLPDPSRGRPDGAQTYESMGENDDVLVLWREWGEAFVGGYRDHIFSQGVFENMTDDERRVVIDAAQGTIHIVAMPDEDDDS